MNNQQLQEAINTLSAQLKILQLAKEIMAAVNQPQEEPKPEPKPETKLQPVNGHHKGGYRMSPRGRANISKSLMGHPVSKETRKKISKAKKAYYARLRKAKAQ